MPLDLLAPACRQVFARCSAAWLSRHSREGLAGLGYVLAGWDADATPEQLRATADRMSTLAAECDRRSATADDGDVWTRAEADAAGYAEDAAIYRARADELEAVLYLAERGILENAPKLGAYRLSTIAAEARTMLADMDTDDHLAIAAAFRGDR